MSAKPVELAEIMLDLGLIQDWRESKCKYCESSTHRLEANGNHVSYRCTGCRATVSILKSEQDIFGARLPLRSLAGALWAFCSPLGLSPDKAGLILGISGETVRGLFDGFHKFLVPIVDRMNAGLQIGGVGFDVELDEIAFRSKRLGDSVYWQRYIAGVRRGSSKVWIHALPDKLVAGGQGGGGPISVAELVDALKPASDHPKLVPGSVVHTDSAKSYRLLGPLYDGD